MGTTNLDDAVVDETVDRLLKVAPDVASALTPHGVGERPYLRRFLFRHSFKGDYSALAEAAATARKHLPFLYAHPELKSLPLANEFSGSQEKILEGKRLEAVRERYPELRDGICQYMHGGMASGWNPLELLALTNGDLSFYDELEKGLGSEELFLCMQKDSDGSQGEAFIGIRPYGRMRDGIQPYLKKLKHGDLIGFYVMAQATVNGEKVAVIETMQTDLLRREKDGTYLVPNREKRYYMSGKEQWLRRTLPKLEEALRRTGVKAVLIPTKEVIFATRIGGINRLMGSTSFEQLYQMPKELGYQKGTGNVSFLRGKSAEGIYWIKPLN